MADKKYYCFCESNCRYETLNKEQILTAIQQAANDGEIKDVDSGFITVLKELCAGVGISLWIGTMAMYNADVANGVDFTNVLCIFTDDTTEEDLLADIAEIKTAVEALQKRNYIVEQGTSGIWTYEKWSNGISKCWANFQYDMEKITFLNDTNNTNTYKPAYCGVENDFCTNGLGIKFPTNLFIDIPFVNYDAANGSGKNGLAFGQGMAKGAKDLATKEYTGAIYIDFPLGVNETDEWKVTNTTDQSTTYTFPSGGYVPCQLSIEAKGRWK